MESVPEELLRRATAWRDADPDPRTRLEIETLIGRIARGGSSEARSALKELTDRFAGTLQFGTAGLRGAVGAGPNRMNRAVVIRAAAGLADYLTVEVDDPQVVIGYDARHGSATFARDSAAVMTAAGCRVSLLPRPLPTPVLAFAVRHLGCDAGVMVTASHNPPQDNGYKVYLGGRVETGSGQGVQLVSPRDRQIAAAIAQAPNAIDVPLAGDGWRVLGDEIVRAYLSSTSQVLDPSGARDLSVVATALHGVGGQVLREAFTGAGFAEPYLVPEQAEPDPDFPTVAFPNPEEAGAIDLAVAAARSRGADLVIANDPDADRCAVAVAVPPSTGRGNRSGGGGWRMLTGDEVGALIADHLLGRGRYGPQATVASSIVSSQLLARIADAHGVRHVATLTGFKWLARVPGLVYAYEEALGYCVAPATVRDKDGITAALVLAELAAELKAKGRTLLDALDDLALAHGVHATEQLSVRVSDLAEITRVMQGWRAEPPPTLAGSPLTEVEDFSAGVGDLPPTDALRWRTDQGLRVVVRPSGTEPKLKCYLEAVVPIADPPAERAQHAEHAEHATADAEAEADSRTRQDALVKARAQAADLLAHARADLSAALHREP